MLRTTIYSLAIGGFVLASGASAVSLQTQSVQSKYSTISYDLAQYFPGQYNRRPIYNRPVQSFPQRPDNTSRQSNPSSAGGQSNSNAASIEQAVFDQINQYRASQNLPALTRNSAIDEQARTHSQNMASGQVPFSHQGADQRFKATGIPYKTASENVAYNQDRDPATSAVQSWLQSPGHLANINSNTNLTGIGVAINGRGVVYLTQIFMRS
ncbi:MAG: CAP domain-containing protein [Trichormus sp.]